MFTLSHRSRQRSLIQQLKDRLILTVGLLVVCLVLTSGIGIFVLITQQQLGDRKVTMTTQINDLSQAMVDQETAIHGYVTTQSTTFLDPFSSGQTDYQTLLQQLKSETTGSNFRSSASALAEVDKQASRLVDELCSGRNCSYTSWQCSSSSIKSSQCTRKSTCRCLQTSYRSLTTGE